MKKLHKISLLAFSLFLVSCNIKTSVSLENSSNSDLSSSTSSSTSSSSSSPFIKKEVTVDNIYESLLELKNAESYRSTFDKQSSLTGKILYVTKNYIYSTKTSSGHMLLKGFEDSTKENSFSYTSSAGNISIKFADVDSSNHYLNSLDSLVKTKQLNISKDMLSLAENGKEVVLKDEENIKLLLDLIGNDEQEPYDVKVVSLRYTSKNELVLLFEDNEGKSFDEATIYDLNSTSYSSSENFYNQNYSSYFSKKSLSESAISFVNNSNFEFDLDISTTDAVGSAYKNYKREVIQKKNDVVYKKRINSDNNLEAEHIYKKENKDGKEVVKEGKLNINNTFEYKEISSSWDDIYKDYFVNNEFKFSNGNTYQYYGGNATKILENLTDSKEYGEVSDFTINLKNGIIDSLDILSTSSSGKKFSIHGTVKDLTNSEISSLQGKPETDISKKIQTALSKLSFANRDSYGFKTSILNRDYSNNSSISHSSLEEVIYTNDVILSYKASYGSPSYKVNEGNGYYVSSENKVNKFDILGSYDTDKQTHSFSYSNNSVIEDSFESKWFNFKIDSKLFYKDENKENTYIVYPNLEGFQTSSPLSLYATEVLDSVAITLDTNSLISSITYTITNNNEVTKDFTMSITYGSKDKLLVSSEEHETIAALGQVKKTSFNDEPNVVATILNDKDNPNPYTAEYLGSIPYLFQNNAEWLGAFAYDYSTFKPNYDEIDLSFDFSYLEGFDPSTYEQDYKALINENTQFKLQDDGSYLNSKYNYKLTVYYTNDPDNFDTNVYIKVVRITK